MPSDSPRPRPFLPLLALLAGGALLAGCTAGEVDGSVEPVADVSGGPTIGPSPDMRPADALDCLPEGSATATTGSEDDPTLVAWTGAGSKAVLLAPQNESGPCEWADQITRLAGEGYLVGTFSWSSDSAQSVRDAVQVLRNVGGQDFALVGASKGGTFVAGLADEIYPKTVVALSPPADFEGQDARAESSTYDGPLLVIASADDTVVPADSSKLVSRADDPSTFVVVDGGAHGVDLFAGPHKAEVEQAIDDALAQGFAD
ncbi:alpha/beta hydrolase [Cellulomonas sp. URHB0016]